MQRYYLGVDTGGTKTHALIADQNGKAIGFGRSGPGNHEVVGYSGTAQAIHEAISQALDAAQIKLEQINAAGFGLAGYDWPSEKEPLIKTIDSLGLHVPFEVVNDVILGLSAGTRDGRGVVVDAGTGNNCRGRDRFGHEGRIAGCGPLFGEFGGGGDIVMACIRAINHEWTLRGPCTRLTQAFMDYYSARDIEDLLEGWAIGRNIVDPLAAPLVFQIAQEGDLVAQDIISWNARELGYSCNAVIRQLGFFQTNFEVVCIGNLFTNIDLFFRPFKQTVLEYAPEAQFIHLSIPPVVGGILIAMKASGEEIPPSREELIASTRLLLEKQPK